MNSKIFILFGILLLLLIGFIVLFLKTKKKYFKWISITFASIYIIVFTIIIVFNNTTQKTIFSNDFSFELQHKRGVVNGSYYEFYTSNSLKEIYDKLIEQKKNAKLENSVIKIFENNCFYKITFNKDKKFYTLNADAIEYFEEDTGNSDIIPFPIEKVAVQTVSDGQEIDISCSENEIKDYYKEFSNVSIQGNSIIINSIFRIEFNNNKILIKKLESNI